MQATQKQKNTCKQLRGFHLLASSLFAFVPLS
jgi:hypothetical protein